MVRLQLISLILLFTVQSVCSQEKPVLSFDLDTTSIKIGEQINYELKIEYEKDLNVEWRDSIFPKPFEIIEKFKIDSANNNNISILTKKYAITSFDSGDYYLKSPKILINNIIYESDSILISVSNIKVDTVSKKFFDIKNIIEVEENDQGWWKKYLILFIIIALLLFTYKLLTRYLVKKADTEKLPLPLEKAIIALQLLEADQLKEQLDYKLYYSKLTDIVKNYLEEDVSLDALESTTDELVNKLELLNDSGKLSLNPETIEKFKNVLKTADLVKFAKSNPGSETAFLDKKTLESVLIDTKEAIPAPSEEELLKNKEYLNKKRKEKKKKILKNILIGLTTLVTVLFTFSILFFGWEKVSDTIVGNPSKKMLKNDWIRSAYGASPIEISTPEVLKRKDSTTNNQQVFRLGDISSNFLASLTINSNQQKSSEEDSQNFVDELLMILKNYGAKNILTKEDSIFIDGGEPAFKIYGSFDYTNESDEEQRKEYISLKFQENNGKQFLLMIFDSENSYSKEISERIEKSIIFKIK